MDYKIAPADDNFKGSEALSNSLEDLGTALESIGLTFHPIECCAC
jgi:hypothetical protein